MGGKMGGRKEIRPLPETITNRWCWTARSAEMIEALRKRFNVTEDLTALSSLELRKRLTRELGGRKINRPKKSAANGTRKAADRSIRASDGEEKQRLVLAETFDCPSCGARLMIARG